MKKLFLSVALVLLLALFTACAPEWSDSVQERFEFSEEKAEAALDPDDPADDSAEAEEGFDFTEDDDDGAETEDGFDFSDEDPKESEDGFEFSEDEVDDAAIDALLLDPPFGTSTWRIVYEVGTLSCPNVDIEVGPQSEQVVSMTAGPLPDLDLISVEGMEENGTITFYRQSFDPSAAVYETADFIPPGGNEVVYYQMTFSSREQEAFADTVEGYIEASFEETVEGTTGRCELFRTFYGFLEGLE